MPKRNGIMPYDFNRQPYDKSESPSSNSERLSLFCFPLFAKRKTPMPITEKQKRKNTAKTNKNESPKEFFQTAFREIISPFHFFQTAFGRCFDCVLFAEGGVVLVLFFAFSEVDRQRDAGLQWFGMLDEVVAHGLKVKGQVIAVEEVRYP